jgi:hypothetical protein
LVTIRDVTGQFGVEHSNFGAFDRVIFRLLYIAGFREAEAKDSSNSFIDVDTVDF